jgi:hypothetical protein
MFTRVLHIGTLRDTELHGGSEATVPDGGAACTASTGLFGPLSAEHGRWVSDRPALTEVLGLVKTRTWCSLLWGVGAHPSVNEWSHQC